MEMNTFAGNRNIELSNVDLTPYSAGPTVFSGTSFYVTQKVYDNREGVLLSLYVIISAGNAANCELITGPGALITWLPIGGVGHYYYDFTDAPIFLPVNTLAGLKPVATPITVWFESVMAYTKDEY